MRAIYCGRAMATLSELTDARELFRNLTLRELRGKYKRSALGWLWSLINPLATMAIFAIGHRVMRFDVEPGVPRQVHGLVALSGSWNVDGATAATMPRT